jgi:hypothetical protein
MKKTTIILVLLFILNILIVPDMISIAAQENPYETNLYSSIQSQKTALILNPSAYVYGDIHCLLIKHSLEQLGYTVVYKTNEAVDVSFTKYNLTTDIIYINTHAGYWDINGDHIPDTVVIATGEYWTNETEHLYSFDINNTYIVKGMVGQQAFVCFTPAFIDYYYNNISFPNTLIYMATCDATYDDSMAASFLSHGAGAYIGWSGSTVFWTNSITSVNAFRDFKQGWTVQQVCTHICYGGLYNRILRSKLTYYGDGELTLI